MFAKHPTYAYYKTPFKGDSIYRESYVNNLEENQRKAQDWNHRISAPSLDPKEIKLKVTAGRYLSAFHSFIDHIKPTIDYNKFERNLSPNPLDSAHPEFFKTISYKPRHEVPDNMSIPSHFNTIYRSEFIKKEMVKRKPRRKIPLFS